MRRATLRNDFSWLPDLLSTILLMKVWNDKFSSIKSHIERNTSILHIKFQIDRVISSNQPWNEILSTFFYFQQLCLLPVMTTKIQRKTKLQPKVQQNQKVSKGITFQEIQAVLPLPAQLVIGHLNNPKVNPVFTCLMMMTRTRIILMNQTL